MFNIEHALCKCGVKHWPLNANTLVGKGLKGSLKLMTHVMMIERKRKTCMHFCETSIISHQYTANVEFK